MNGDQVLKQMLTDGTNSRSPSRKGMLKSARKEPRTVFAGDGNVQPPEPPEEEGVDLEHMGAELRAHCWDSTLVLSSSPSSSQDCSSGMGSRTRTKASSNLLRLRYKHMRPR